KFLAKFLRLAFWAGACARSVAEGGHFGCRFGATRLRYAVLCSVFSAGPAAAPGGRRSLDLMRSVLDCRPYTVTASASVPAWTRFCTAALAPVARTNCWSWLRNRAPAALAITLPTPPSSDVPPRATAATEGSR